MPHLSGLFLYPVKSLRGCAVTELAVDELGPVGDRRFLIVDEGGRFLTQRVLPRMARISTALTTDLLQLSAEGAGTVQVPRRADPAAPLRTVAIWKNEGLLAEDCGDASAAWLTDLLATRCRLVRIGRKFHRPLKPSKAQPGDVVSFADAYPFLILGEASLAVLNDRLLENEVEPVPMDRFRANLIVSDCAPFAEDTWTRCRIGDLTFRAGGPCARCIMTTTDQATGERTGPEPLHTLAQFRRDAGKPSEVNFGQNLIHETKSGILRLADPVTIL